MGDAVKLTEATHNELVKERAAMQAEMEELRKEVDELSAVRGRKEDWAFILSGRISSIDRILRMSRDAQGAA